MLLHDPSGSLQPQQAQRARRALAEASGLPVGLYCQGAGGNALAAALEAARAGADLIAVRRLPASRSRSTASRARRSRRRSPGSGSTPASTSTRSGARRDLVDEHIGDEPVTPLAPRIAVRAAEHRLPPGLVAALDSHLRAHGAGDRIDEVLDELARIRDEVGWPPLAAPIGQILGSQALLHVLSASALPDGRRRAARADRRPLRDSARRRSTRP